MSKQTGMVLSTGTVKSNPGAEKLFFEVPIHRCSKDKFSDEMAREKARCLSPIKRLRERAPKSYATAERRFDETEWYPWPYNEAIG